jgi:hypothetical protein
VDPQCPNYENVQRFLRGPLIALTVNHVLPHLPTSNVASKPKADVEEKTSRSGGDWRDFLTDDPDAHGSVVGQFATEKAQEAYLRLSRRTQARMEAFLAGCALAAPNEMGNNLQKHADQQSSDLVTLQEGLSGFGISTSGNASTKGSQTAVLIRNISSVSSVSHHPQIQQEDLILRLELYTRTLQRVRTIGEECVMAMEPPKEIKARSQVITHAFVATAGTIRNLRHVLTRLLNCLTMEEMAVEVLSDDVKKVIRRIVSEYEHGTSFASLAFLSTPEVNADSLLLPLGFKVPSISANQLGASHLCL